MFCFAFSSSIGQENRIVPFFKEVGPNLRTWGRDVNEEYLKGPWKRGDPIQKVTGPVMAGLSALLEGTDQIFAGAVDQKVERPTGLIGRTRRDVRSFVKNVFTLHPLRALSDGFRAVTADPLLDAGDAIGGHIRK